MRKNNYTAVRTNKYQIFGQFVNNYWASEDLLFSRIRPPRLTIGPLPIIQARILNRFFFNTKTVLLGLFDKEGSAYRQPYSDETCSRNVVLSKLSIYAVFGSVSICFSPSLGYVCRLLAGFTAVEVTFGTWRDEANHHVLAIRRNQARRAVVTLLLIAYYPGTHEQYRLVEVKLSGTGRTLHSMSTIEFPFLWKEYPAAPGYIWMNFKCDPGSGLRVGRREGRRCAKIMNGIRKKEKKVRWNTGDIQMQPLNHPCIRFVT